MSETAMEWVPHPPHPALRPLIDRYVGYRTAGFPASVHRGLPSRHMTFIVGIGEPIEVMAQTDRRQPPRAYRSVLSGLQASTALIADPGHQEGVTIELTPLGSRTLLGMPARELWDRSLELDEVIGRPGDELWERLQGGAGWLERFAACDEVLLGLTGDQVVAPELADCWRTLVGSGGRIGIQDLAAHTGYSRQHLGRRFRDEFGLSPKLAARVVRFERARHVMRSIPPYVTLAEVAAACGYYDQAHLARDVAEFAGCTPTDLTEEPERPAEVDAPFVQDGDPFPGGP